MKIDPFRHVDVKYVIGVYRNKSATAKLNGKQTTSTENLFLYI